MKIDISTIALDNVTEVMSAAQQLIILRQALQDAFPGVLPETIDVILRLVVAPMNIVVNTTPLPKYIAVNPNNFIKDLPTDVSITPVEIPVTIATTP